jgi:hypothetical protein
MVWMILQIHVKPKHAKAERETLSCCIKELFEV